MAIFTTSKINNDPTNGKLNAVEWNQLADLNNAITTSGQTTIDSDLYQYAKAMAAYNSLFYSDSGTANNYVLTAKNSLKAPNNYFDGMTVKFRAGNASTGASVINVASLGSKDIKKPDGATAISAGDITTGFDTELRYDGTVFRLVSNQLIGFSAYLSSNQTINTNTFTKINFSTAIVNRNDNSIFNTATSRFTPTIAGWYNINCGLFFTAPLSPNNAFTCNAVIYKNGTLYKGNSQSYCQNVNHEVINSFFLFMNGSTDYLELYGFAGALNPTYTIIGGVSSYFQAFKI